MIELLLTHHQSIPERKRMLTLEEGKTSCVIEERIVGQLNFGSLNVVDVDRCSFLT